MLKQPFLSMLSRHRPGVPRAAANSSSRPRKKATTKPNRTRTTAVVSGVRFHGPSFSGGIVFGALLVLTVAYLPELTSLAPGSTSTSAGQNSGAVAAGTPVTDASTALRFEFEDLLSNSEITPDRGRYEQPQEDLSELYLQAASFRTQEEADRLRADLLLMDLPTSTAPVELASGRWIRVTVGPFSSPVQANRAMTALRDRNIAPIWIKRKVTG